MLAVRDNLAECLSALRAHKLRASLTMLGLTMGVATLITVMTIVQGANVYVEQKIANLGTNVFQIARTPFAVTDFNIVIKALKFRKIELEDMQTVRLAARNASRWGEREFFHSSALRQPR
jgi:putative ABC transport system permease protein